jgi:putative spermidine/putrescine transport system substrate-binding protein
MKNGDSRKMIAPTSRRAVLKQGVATVVAGAGPLLLLPGRARAGSKLVVVGYGGSYGDFTQENFIKPFSRQTGIEVDVVTTPDISKVRQQVGARKVEWDVFDGGGSVIFAGSRDGLWEPVNRKIVDVSDLAVPVGQDKMPTFIFSGGSCWNRTRTPLYKAPTDFSLFFDTKLVGARALRDRVSETLEMALLADGVTPERLYPLDVERAFKALDRLKPTVKRWVNQTPEMTSLVETGQVEYSYNYASRVKAAVAAGQPLAFGFNQVINAQNYHVVLRGSPNKEAAFKYINFVVSSEQQRRVAEVLGCTPVSKRATLMASHDARKWMADLSNPRSAMVNDAYWEKNFADLDRRYKEWIKA